MGIRKNAKALTAAERETLVTAFLKMKNDLVNPTAAPADQFSKWDQHVAVHWAMQNVNTPGANGVNSGHGGLGSYAFCAWHRYFLYLLEQQLQTYMPGTGLMLPYWDWTDPTGAVMVEDFLGPNGDPTSNNEVRQGYLAKEAPGTGANLTPLPSWWPTGLAGWNLPAAFGDPAGALRRLIGPNAALPSIASIRSVLDMATYSDFQNGLEAGVGVNPPHRLHNALHPWFGPNVAQMNVLRASPFDPMFYLHHCNVDRIWAMWQMDGHDGPSWYPASGGVPGHNLNDTMYPWIGSASGYSTINALPGITLPDFSALGPITPADVLDHRALGYSYDTQVVIGVALDRTGSMTAMTPDPMDTSLPDVTKWEAATRGVSAFLQDCEAAYDNAEAYVVAGVETFCALGSILSGTTNDFVQVFPGTPYGLVKVSGAYSRAVFDSVIATQSPDGITPLADALLDTYASLVTPPFGWLPADERRYLAMLTDGILTSGSPMSSIPDGSLANTAVFAMGFGTGADVDYTTLAEIVAKGQITTGQQVFQGENAGTIDKFYSQALAAAIGYTPILDPVLQLFEGEHVHLDFSATSAEEAFFITAQGMDFEDSNWAYQLIGPDGAVIYADSALPAHAHGGGAHSAGRRPYASARRGHGRLSLFVSRDSADNSAWVGAWTLMIAWRARELDGMVMLDVGTLLAPVAAGPLRGPRYSRLLVKPEERKAARAISATPRHRLDVWPASTNRSDRPACSVVVNVYARTRLKVGLRPEPEKQAAGTPLAVDVVADTLRGSAASARAFSRLIAPTQNLLDVVRKARLPAAIAKSLRLPDSKLKVDAAGVLAHLEKRTASLARIRDEELRVVEHHEGPLHVHVEKTDVPGLYHLGIWIEGTYQAGQTPAQPTPAGSGHEMSHAAPRAAGERFERLLSLSVNLPVATTRVSRKARKPSRPKRTGRSRPRPSSR